MEQDEIIRMAREAGAYLLMRLDGEYVDNYQISGNASIGRFAALIEAAATEKANERANASWASMCEKMVAAEREACARVCESESEVYAAYARAEKAKLTAECAALIRARGNLK